MYSRPSATRSPDTQIAYSSALCCSSRHRRSPKELPRHFDDDAYAALQAFLGAHPEAGDLIRGTGGIRKIRWTMPGRGKRGGNRVVYYWLAKENHIYLLTLYAKGVKDDLTPAERDAWRRAVEAIDND